MLPSTLRDVNQDDIPAAIRLGCQTMSSVFNADDNDIPFFRSVVWPRAELSFNRSHSESHVPGRHLNALLNAEVVLRMPASDEVIDKHARAAFFSFNGPLPLPLNRERIDGPLVNFLPHNLREGFHALFALAKYRDSQPAREMAERCIDAIFRLWKPEQGWDRKAIEDEAGLKLIEWSGPFISGIARAIGPLVKYYQATGFTPALQLAIALKEEALRHFNEAGDFHDGLGHHTHSITCTMSSLAQLADLLRDAPLMNVVRAFYNNGLWKIRDALGWVIENTSAHRNPDFGEVNNTGDVLETALILGRWGYTEAYADAERILRGHLLPSQLRDISFITDLDNPNNEDGKRNVARRHLGAFGFPAPYGHLPIDCPDISFNMDIVGGAIGSLCEAYREATRFDDAGHWVNLLFDHDTDAIRVESPYTHAALRITLKKPGTLFVRVPDWHASDDVVAGVENMKLSNGYMMLPQALVNVPIEIPMKLTSHELVLKHRTRDIRVRMLGDKVVGMDHFGAPLRFFAPFA
jgi:hypothetical protein